MQSHLSITSDSNPLIKDIRKAVSRGGPTADGLIIAETFHLLEEALRSRAPIEYVLASETAATRAQSAAGSVRVTVLPDKLFESISATEHPQGVMTLVRSSFWQIGDFALPGALVVISDGLSDPGNAGALIRSAEAFGAAGLVVTKGSVSPYNPKAIRASAGSIFRVPFVNSGDGEELVLNMVERGFAVYAAHGRAERSITDVDFRDSCALVIGNEARGISDAVLEIARPVRIPTQNVESLNAAVASGIILYEAARQRGGRSHP